MIFSTFCKYMHVLCHLLTPFGLHNIFGVIQCTSLRTFESAVRVKTVSLLQAVGRCFYLIDPTLRRQMPMDTNRVKGLKSQFECHSMFVEIRCQW